MARRNFRSALRGEYLTNYPTYHVMADGGTLCNSCMEKEWRLVLWASKHPGCDTQWQYEDTDVNYEDDALYCDHCEERIASAYGDPDEDEEEEEEEEPDAWICTDCACWIANADLSGLDYDNPEEADRIRACAEELPDGCVGNLSDDFRNSRCDCCGSLPGSRVSYLYFNND